MAKTFNDIIEGLYIQIGLVEKEYENGAGTASHISETLFEIQEKIKKLEEREPNIEGLEELKQKLELLKAVDMTQYVTKAELPDLLSQTDHLLTETEAEELYVKKSEIPTIKGEKGEIGEPGEQGLMGPQGPTGERGPQGLMGPQGPTGPTGERGLKGDKGERGPQGSEGAQGPTGERGPQGLMGPQGPTGPTGERGLKGDKGDRGPQGPEGPQGPKGADGRDADIPDLSEYAKKSELPDVSNHLTEYQADVKYVLNSELSAYARKTDIPQPQDLSNYALKSEITNLPQGGSTNVTAKDISKLLTTIPITYYEQLMDGHLAFFNDSDKAVTITVKEFDKTQPYPYPVVDKEYTFQPYEEWEFEYDVFEPIKEPNTYLDLVVKVDGKRMYPMADRFTPEPRWGLKAYIKPDRFNMALVGGLNYWSNKYNILTRTKFEEMLREDFNFGEYGIFKKLATKTYVDSKLVDPKS